MRRYPLLVLILAACFSARAQEHFLSKLYFPGLVGLDLHLYDGHLVYKKGIVLNTGIEFRPGKKTVFFRFNYDALSSRYISSPLSALPTNVSNGTLHLNYFLAGVGYRKRNKLTGWYLLAQTGLEQRTYDKVTITSDGFTIDQVGKKALGVKFTAGLEYYLAEHFALVLEPAFYPGSYYALQGSSNKNLSVGIGFTTTLF